MIDLNVPVEGKTLVALLFSTERIPFVVKNIAHNQEGGGPVELEVPWRENCSTKSARRADLIRLLTPISRLPAVEFLGASIVVRKPNPDYNISIKAHLYIYPYNFQKSAIPCHRSELKAKIDDIEFGESENIVFEPLLDRHSDRTILGGSQIECTKHEAIINGPGLLHVNAYSVRLPSSKQIPSSDAMLTVKLTPADNEKSIVAIQNLKRISKKRNQETFAEWVFGRRIDPYS